jgi:hypothetical protein
VFKKREQRRELKEEEVAVKESTPEDEAWAQKRATNPPLSIDVTSDSRMNSSSPRSFCLVLFQVFVNI